MPGIATLGKLFFDFFKDLAVVGSERSIRHGRPHLDISAVEARIFLF
jgi:hypothetical protein